MRNKIKKRDMNEGKLNEVRERIKRQAEEHNRLLTTPKELCRNCRYWTTEGINHCEHGTAGSYNYLIEESDNCPDVENK